MVDGDTFHCQGGPKVRLLLIDAPERDQRPFGGQARQALAALLPAGSTVALESDVARHDRYGRTLAYVYLGDGRMVNEAMAGAGYAVPVVYPPNVRYIERVRSAAAAARAGRRGLWRVSGFACAPAEHRRRRC